jgi:hypothetical protein
VGCPRCPRATPLDPFDFGTQETSLGPQIPYRRERLCLAELGKSDGPFFVMYDRALVVVLPARAAMREVKATQPDGMTTISSISREKRNGSVLGSMPTLHGTVRAQFQNTCACHSRKERTW